MRGMQAYEIEQFGVFRTDRMRYAPLDTAKVAFICRNAPVETYRIEVCDGAGRPYFTQDVPAPRGEARFSFPVGGAPGLHVIRAFTDGASGFYPFRMGSFVLRADTDASAEGTDLAEFMRWLREALEASVDWAQYGGRWVAGDKYADNSTMNLAYPRFRLDASVYFEPAEQLKGSLDLIYAEQQEDGSLCDHIYGDGHPGWEGARKIRSMMADLETGSIINVYQVWMATGDTEWMKAKLKPMLRGWRYATTSPDLWSAEHGLIKRPHTADEWDVQTGDGSCFRNANSVYVTAVCDAVRLPKAADCLAAMLEAAGRSGEAASLRRFAADARKRANALLWDGAKYRHHHHIDPLDHGSFDESAQLAMGNTWACNDGLADPVRAVMILEEYERRLEATGDRYPWWSLQPGYPEGWFPKYPPGMYCNGGLFPWVGGELCRACFRHGLGRRGWRMFNEFRAQVAGDDGVCATWLTCDGHAAANTAWTTNQDPWSVGAWGRTAIEAVLGVTALEPGMARCRCVLQWPAGDVRTASACVAMPAARGYLAYRYAADRDGVHLVFTGTGKEVLFAFPMRLFPTLSRAVLNSSPVPVTAETDCGVRCLAVRAPVEGVSRLDLLEE